MTSTQESLANEVATSPMDRDLRGIYADCLDESGSYAEAKKQRNIAYLLRGSYTVDPKCFTNLICNCCGLMDYTGRKVKLVCVKDVEEEVELNHYNTWDGGTCVYRSFYWPNGHTINPVYEIHHSIYCGKDTGITILGTPDDIINLIPDDVQLFEQSLSWAEKVVLCATRSYKSSYAGVSDYRYAEAHRMVKISKEEWERAKSELISKGLLNKAGAITSKGKNAVGREDLYNLKKS